MADEQSAAPIVVIGGGIGGVFTTYHLTEGAPRKAKQNVTLISDDDHFVFKPLLPEAIGGGSRPEFLGKELADLAKDWGFEFVRAKVRRIDLDRQCVITNTGEVAYRDLVFAAGSEVETHGIDIHHEGVYTLHTVPDSEKLRAHVLAEVERAIHTSEPDARRRALTFICVGGGATGVETICEMQEAVWGALADAKVGDLHKEDTHFRILEAGDELLPLLDSDLREAVRKSLADRGIELELNALVTEMGPGRCTLKDGRSYEGGTVLWAAGIRPVPVVREGADLPRNKQGQLEVDDFLRVKGHDNLFAVGDDACCFAGGREQPVPATGQAAIQEAKAVAGNLIRRAQGEDLEQFEYEELGVLVTLGTGEAVGLIRGRKVEGVPGWLASRAAYFARHLGLDNRIHLALGWAKHALTEALMHPLWR